MTSFVSSRREFRIEGESAAEESRSVPVVCSTEYPVERGQYHEVLDPSPGAVDLGRAPLPVIETHDAGVLNIGVVEGLCVMSKKLRGVLRLGRSARARELWADIKAGVVRCVSVAYTWRAADTRPEGGGVLRVLRWQPYEVSLVATPADPDTGLNRSYFPNSQQESKMSTGKSSEKKPEDLTRSQRRAANSAEIERITKLIDLGMRNNQVEVARRYITDDRSAAEFESFLSTFRNQSPRTPSQLPFYGDEPPTFADEFNRLSLLSACAAQIPGARADFGRELEASQELSRMLGRKPQGVFFPIGQTRAAISKAGQGAPFVGTELLASEFIDVLRARSRVIALGAQELNQLIGDVTIPRKTGGSNIYWVAEGADVSEGGATFDNLTMAPKTVGVYQDVTRKMILQGTPETENMVREDLAASIATEIDRVVINGSGAGEEPTGILNTTGIGLVPIGTDGGAPTWDHIVDLQGLVSDANADEGQLAYLTNSKVRSKLLKAEKFPNSGESVWQDSTRSDTDSARVAGFRAMVSNNVPNDLTKGAGTNLSAILFGNWRDVLIGHWGVVDVLVDPYTLGLSGGVRLRAMLDVDILIRHEESFAAIMDAAA